MSSQNPNTSMVGFFEHRAEHGDEELGVGVHHFLDEGGVVVEQLAKPLDAGQVPQRAEKPAPAVGDHHQGIVAVLVLPQLRRQSAPIRPARSGCIRSRQNLRKSAGVSTG